jgi:hypothetical protein
MHGKVIYLDMGSAASSISAEVILKSRGNRSIASNETRLTSENIENYRPSKKLINDTVGRLKKLGFDIFPSDFTLTIVGKKSLFEEVFKIKFAVDEDERNKRINLQPNKELTIPPTLSDVVEKVVFTPQPQFFT